MEVFATMSERMRVAEVAAHARRVEALGDAHALAHGREDFHHPLLRLRCVSGRA